VFDALGLQVGDRATSMGCFTSREVCPQMRLASFYVAE
jgi:hypothetical protein